MKNIFLISLLIGIILISLCITQAITTPTVPSNEIQNCSSLSTCSECVNAGCKFCRNINNISDTVCIGEDEAIIAIYTCKTTCSECKGEGKSFNTFDEPDAYCCSGLIQIPTSVMGETDCIAPSCPCYVCTKCGDGECGIGENRCNCPEDCESEERSSVEAANYIIFIDNSTIKAKNGRTGTIEFSGTDAAIVIQSALNALTNGRTWKEKVILKGNFIVSSQIQIHSYTIFEIQGKITLGANLPDTTPILSNSDFINGNKDIEIIGGEIDGKKSLYTSGYGIYFNAADEKENTNIRVKDTYIHDIYGQGLSYRYTDNSFVENVLLKDNGVDSIYHNLYLLRSDNLKVDAISLSADFGRGVKIDVLTNSEINIMSLDNANAGMTADSISDVKIKGILSNNGLSGISLTNSKRVLLEIVANSNANDGIYLRNVADSVINAVSMNAPDTRCGLRIVDSHGIVVKGRYGDDQASSTQSYGIRSTGTSDYITITGTDVRGNTVSNILLVGSNNIVKNNLGYTEE